jgi:type VI secretion system protein VasJ
VAGLADIAALGQKPISEAAPAGAPARYEPEFEKLSAEIGKLESVDGKGSIHWDTVVESAAAVLDGKSKDLLAASYLTLGLLQENGYAGLAAGLAVVRDMLGTYWDALFPEKNRLRARAQAIQWMGDRIPPFLQERGDPSKSDREALQAAVDALKAVVEFAGQKFEEGGPNLGELQQAVEYKLASVPQDAPPPSSEPSPPEASSGASAPPAEAAAPAPREIDSPDAAREALAEMRERRVKAARVLREANAADPMAYRLLRQAVWEDVLEAPAAKDGVTELSGGDASFAQQAEEKLEKGEYASVIAEAEDRLPGDRLWLDLNFLACRAMEGLGRPYAAARRALGDEVARLVRGAPGLLEVKFADGTPMAGEAARLWIQHELGALPGGPAGAATGLDAVLAEARKLVARKNFPEAAGLLQKEIRSAPQRRDRFLARLALARLCAEAGRPEMALPQLEGLDEETRKFALEEWEPSLAADVARELWRCHKGSATPERANEFYARLCRLDPAAALAADGKKK